ncbi:hypothetical protein LguiB_031602 [Lonicera macranthoides]
MNFHKIKLCRSINILFILYFKIYKIYNKDLKLHCGTSSNPCSSKGGRVSTTKIAGKICL